MKEQEACTHAEERNHSDRHHMTMIYADYFFMEAVFTLAGKGLFIW